MTATSAFIVAFYNIPGTKDVLVFILSWTLLKSLINSEKPKETSSVLTTNTCTHLNTDKRAKSKVHVVI
jgi:hypothetical protein